MVQSTALETSPGPRAAPRIAVWTEGGPGIGMGHVVRTLVVAEELRTRGVEPLFFIDGDKATIRHVTEKGFELNAASIDADGCELILGSGIAATLLDTKKPAGHLVKRLRQAGCRAILMDHAREPGIEADAWIIPSAFWDPDVKGKSASTGCFGGPHYVPISKAYRAYELRSQETPPPWRVLVTMGGSDPNLLTCRVAAVLRDLGDAVRATLVIGPSFPKDERLDDIAKKAGQRMRCVRGVWDLSSLMAEAHLVVTGLGTTMYEAAYLGKPVVVIGNYESDVPEMNALEVLRIGVGVGYHAEVADTRIRACIEKLMRDPELCRSMSARGRALIDGLGAERIAEIILSLLPTGD